MGWDVTVVTVTYYPTEGDIFLGDAAAVVYFLNDFSESNAEVVTQFSCGTLTG